MSKTDSDIPAFTLKDYFPYQVRLFYRDVTAAVKEVYASRYGLSIHEWRTMAVLSDYEPLSAKEIVMRSGVDKVNISRAITCLQSRQFLERHVDPTDRRRALLRLTPQGKKIMRALLPLILDVEQQMLSALSPEEQAQLRHLMAKMTQSANQVHQGLRQQDVDD